MREREYGIESDGTGRNVRRGEGTENEKLGKLREHRRRMGKVRVKRREKKRRREKERQGGRVEKQESVTGMAKDGRRWESRGGKGKGGKESKEVKGREKKGREHNAVPCQGLQQHCTPHCTPHRLYTPVCYSFIHSDCADIFRVYAVLSCLCLYSASRSA